MPAVYGALLSGMGYPAQGPRFASVECAACMLPIISLLAMNNHLVTQNVIQYYSRISKMYIIHCSINSKLFPTKQLTNQLNFHR